MIFHALQDIMTSTSKMYENEKRYNMINLDDNRIGTKHSGNWGEGNSLVEKAARSWRRDLADPGILTDKDDVGAEESISDGEKWIRKGPEGTDTDTVDSASDLFLADSRCSQYVCYIAEWLNEWISMQGLEKTHDSIRMQTASKGTEKALVIDDAIVFCPPPRVG